MAQEPRTTFANHPDTERSEQRAWEAWVWAARHGTVTRSDREDLLPTIRAWMQRRALDRRV